MQGVGRWIDARDWTYEFEQALPAGVACEFTLNASIKTLAGNAIADAKFRFNTGGPAFEERRLDAFRVYYRYVPTGKWTVTYNVRFNQDGTFQLPESRVEAMYAPEIFGLAPNAAVTIKP